MWRKTKPSISTVIIKLMDIHLFQADYFSIFMIILGLSYHNLKTFLWSKHFCPQWSEMSLCFLSWLLACQLNPTAQISNWFYSENLRRLPNWVTKFKRSVQLVSAFTLQFAGLIGQKITGNAPFILMAFWSNNIVNDSFNTSTLDHFTVI